MVCFTSQQKGHKSPQCPQRITKVKRIHIPRNRIVPLKQNELLGTISGHSLPITCDSGADITVVPEECVGEGKFTGDLCTIDSFNNVKAIGKRCRVKVKIHDRVFVRDAVTQPACLSLNLSMRDELQFIMDQVDKKHKMMKEQLCYMPPTLENGILKSAIMVSDGAVVGNNVDTPVTPSELTPQSEEGPAESGHAEVLVEGDESVPVEREENLAPDVVTSSVLEEEVDKQKRGGRVGPELMLQNITSQMPRTPLAQATADDPTLTTARSLANSLSEGYYWQEHLLFRTRLDRLGDATEQLCLPADYRPKCLKMAHEHFGHLGRNKLTEHITKFYYWPTVTVDCMKHIKSCQACQKMDKSRPKQMYMQEREVVRVPSESVAIDLVGPFTKAKADRNS